ncbi:hypothetical protein HF348_004414 [Salmonella enterica]|uniref:Uncharacterized protein n=7 Tax=Enterobacteriaceae TaxID=543 RepID=A0A5V3NFG5_SALER|nr:hypothetical protein SPAB_05385 [Salmonella enterica subsp. enterica serovar Paratyphi B str. SPB7]APZ68646.1 hypothetical protein LFZ43_23175 [Salmonella enterica subsp. enterica serovar Wandsworth str. SA20092095]AXD11194.1 hypothetical protein CHE29_21215 [Salmonella enterica]EAA1342937.1 hypothetical protein [Salmonella enterica subsp. enterica serovar Java]EAA6244783.1 hypothetical protein [Salmonella enterica subsp. enterica serovar Kentucky]EAA7609330.1 hypothetical protein [Salmonel
MGIKMQNNKNLEYRVDYTPLGGRLFAGFVRRDNGKWEGNRHEVTEQALLAVGKKLLSEGNGMQMQLPDGRVIRLSAVISDSDEAEVHVAQF